MKRKVVYTIFALMLLGISLSGCRSKELCPAYTQNTPDTEQVAEAGV